MSHIEWKSPRKYPRAIAAARGVVREEPDWWMPVLFMRLKSGQLWDDETKAEAAATAQTAYQAKVVGSGAIAQGPRAASATR